MEPTNLEAASCSAPMEPVVFIDTSYSYRSWRTAVVILFFGGIGSFMTAEIVHHLIFKSLPHGRECFVFVFVLLFTVGFLWTAVFLLLKFIRNERAVARIDSNGITQGNYFFSWDRVRYIAATRSGSRGWMLKYGIRRRPDGMFWIGRPFTRKEYEDLRDRLDPFLEQNFPDVGLGT